MAEYTPRVVTFGRALQTWAIEENFRKVVDLLGGDAYYNGFPYTASRGALTEANLASSLKMANAMKAAPYAVASIPLYVNDPGVGNSVAYRVGGVSKLLAKTTVVRLGMTFSYASGGPLASGTVTVGWTGVPAGVETLTFTNLAPLTVSSLANRVALGSSADGTIAVVVATTAGAFTWGCVTLRLLLKHVS